jgi:putative ABC transport system permease protein
MKIPVLAGRALAATDRKEGAPVALINERLARQWWKTPQEAIGAEIQWGRPGEGEGTYQVVGVIGNAPQFGPDTTVEPEITFAFAQRPVDAMAVMIRVRGDASRLIPEVRRQVARLDANIPIEMLRPYTEWMGDSLERRRFTTGLLSLFAGVAVILATVGIYGVMNYSVNTQRREIAVRIALGATQGQIARWIGRYAFRLTGAALAAGSVATLMFARWMKSMVFGVGVLDPFTMVSAAVLLGMIVAVACTGPLLSAIHVDPSKSLRDG